MRKLLLITFAVMCVFYPALSADDFNYKLSGFVKTDVIYDTRQTESIREGHFLLLPLNESLDVNGDDINAKPNFNILSVQTRARLNISGPMVLDAKTSGFIEGAFFGSTNGNINTFRLRHAYVKFDWEKTHLLAGQHWHPMFITDNFPDVVSFNTGAPFQPFTRNPQLTLTQDIGPASITVAAVSQRDFASSGPKGGTSEYIRNAVIPELFFGAKVKLDEHVFGVGGKYMTLMPRISTEGTGGTYAAEETIGSMGFEGYLKLKFDKLQIKAEGIYGQNMMNYTMLGGYAVSAYDPVTGAEEYTNINTLSAWGEIIYGKDVQFGLFGGYSKNLGADDNIVGDIWARGADIESVIRVSPRVILNWDKVRVAGEIEYTSAAFGTIDKQDKGLVKDSKDITNMRALIAFYIFF